MNPPAAESAPMWLPTWRYVWRLIRFTPWLYLAIGLLRILIFCVAPQATGLAMRAFFDSLTGHAPASLAAAGETIPWLLCAFVVAIALARAGAIFADVTAHNVFHFTTTTLLRKNLFERILDRPGARAVPGSPGEAISRFREDVDDLAGFITDLPFLIGLGLLTATAIAVMLGVNPRITLAVFLPLVIVILAANRATHGIEKYRQANRKAAAAVTDFVGELFGAVQAVKVATAEASAVDHFRALNETRRRAALKDRLFNEVLNSVFWNAVNLGTGLILLLAGQAMRPGPDGTPAFTIGDFALFVYYLGWSMWFTSLLGTTWARYKQSGVSVERLLKLLQGAPPETLVRHSPVYMRGPLPEVPYHPKTAEHRLEKLEAFGLSYHYPDTGRGIAGIHLSLARGTFTVVTGRIGSGKTTLLRVLLGLLPGAAGEVRWNGQVVHDPASFFVPPRAAYTAQVPLLFSESLRDNILMGLPEEQVDLAQAIRLAVLEQDVGELEAGLDTLIGAKGVKISGGQRQRAAAARMFVRDPELLVLDDLSSALDVETERMLWERVFERKDATCLVVSHRRPALRRANHIIVLKDGRMVDEGDLNSLLDRCEEMQHLWQGDWGTP